jgi:hypothetical protein
MQNFAEQHQEMITDKTNWRNQANETMKTLGKPEKKRG